MSPHCCFSLLLCGCRADAGVACAGMFGAFWAEFIQNYHLMPPGAWKQFLSLLFSTVINLSIGLCPFVDNFARA